MPPVKQRPRAKTPAAPALPRLTVAKVKEAGLLLERLVDENTDLFIAKGQAYRDKHREGTGRELDYVQLGQLAAAMAITLADAKEQVDDAGIRYWDEPARNEILIAAGVATAPAFIEAAQRFTALVEMDAEQFRTAREDDALDDALRVATAELDALDISAARARASAAIDHFARGVADTTGKGLGIIAQSVIQGLTQAMSHLEPSTPSSLIDSAASTEDSPSLTSSTSFDTPAPSN